MPHPIHIIRTPWTCQFKVLRIPNVEHHYIDLVLAMILAIKPINIQGMGAIDVKHGIEFPSVGSDVVLQLILYVLARHKVMSSKYCKQWFNLSHQGVEEQTFQHPAQQPKSPGGSKDMHDAIEKEPPNRIGTGPL